MVTTSRRPAGGFAHKASTIEEEPKRDTEIRAEERGEDREPPLRRHRAGRSDTEAASKVADERQECERADESPSLHQRDPLGFEGFAPLLVPARFAHFSARRALLGALAPLAAPSTSCHERRLALCGAPAPPGAPTPGGCGRSRSG